MKMSKRTVRRLIARHCLPVIRVGGSVRIHPTDLDRYIASRRFG